VVPLDDYSIATRLPISCGRRRRTTRCSRGHGKQLSTPEGVKTQVTRMISSPAFASTLTAFHEQ